MKKHGAFFVPNIVLGIILAIILVIDIVVVIALHQEFEEVKEDYAYSYQHNNDEEDYYNWYSMLSIREITAEPIGATYQNETAEDGYQYYKVNFSVVNEGNDSYDGTYFWFAGEGYDDVREVEESREDNNFEYYNRERIPAGQSAVVSKVIEVKDGVNSVQLAFYNEEHEQEEYTVELQ